MKDIEFFGSIDRKQGKPDGMITSEYPAWMHRRAIEELEEEINSLERQNEQAHLGLIPYEQIARNKERVRGHKAKLELIRASTPKLTDDQKDDYYKVYKELQPCIQDAMFTRSEMMLGTANAHEEVERMITPSIPVSPEIAKACNLKAVDGKISRDEASRAFKMIGSLLGEPTNVEVLRRDKVTQRTGGRPPKK